MYFSKIRKYLLPQEVLAIPFLLLLLFICSYFGLQIVLVPDFIYWLALLFLQLALIYIVYFMLALGFNYITKHSVYEPRVSWKKIFRFLRISLSLAAILIVYENLQFAIEYISPVDQDEAILFYDQAFFGFKNMIIYLESWIRPWLTEWFSFAYLSFFFYLPIMGGYFFWKNRLNEWSLLVLTITLTLFSGYILYIFFPAVGPGVYLADLFTKTLDGAQITESTKAFVSTHGFAKGTFPSLHVACSSVYLYFAYKNSKILFIIFLPLVVSLWLSTVYLRHHYIIDLLAGFCLAIITIALANFIYKKWNEKA
jgi:membrane-associated phospholipid phosphatase